MTPLPRGVCPVCKISVALRNGGLVREHRYRPGDPMCEGSGEVGLVPDGGDPPRWVRPDEKAVPA